MSKDPTSPKHRARPRGLAANLRVRVRVAAAFFAIGLIIHAPVQADPAPATAPATQPTTDTTTGPVVPSSPEIERLLGQFQSDNWRIREQAQGALAAMAQAAEPRLRQFVGTTQSAEARSRAQVILNQVASLRRLGAILISLHLKDATAQDAYAELSRQCRIPIAAQGENLWRRVNQPTITLDLTAEPFWVAMRRLCVAFGLRAVFPGADDDPPNIILIRDPGEEMPSPAAFNGSFMMLATSLTRHNAFDAADDRAGKTGNAETSISIEVTFFADPKWRIVSHPERATIESASDDRGKPLPQVDPMVMQVFKPGNPIWIMRTNIRHVPRQCAKIENLKGNFRITLLEQSDPLEVPNILSIHNALRRVGGRLVQIREAVRDGDGYKLSLSIFRNGLSEQDWRQQRELQGISLLDEKGRSLTRSGVEARENGDQVDYDLNFIKADPGGQAASAGDPVKLVIQLPLEPREVNVPFEFKEIAIQK